MMIGKRSLMPIYKETKKGGYWLVTAARIGENSNLRTFLVTFWVNFSVKMQTSFH